MLKLSREEEPRPTLEEIRLAYPRHCKIWPTQRAIFDALETIRERDGMNDVEASRWLLARVQAYARSDEGRGRYCPNPDRWFMDGRYYDDDSAWQERKETQDGPRVKPSEIAERNRREC